MYSKLYFIIAFKYEFELFFKTKRAFKREFFSKLYVRNLVIINVYV